VRPGKHHVSLTGCHAEVEGTVSRHLLPLFPPSPSEGHRSPPPSAHAQSSFMPSVSPPPQTTPAPRPKGTGVAPRGTRSHARGSPFPLRGASPLQPAMNNPSGLQADPPLTLSPVR